MLHEREHERERLRNTIPSLPKFRSSVVQGHWEHSLQVLEAGRRIGLRSYAWRDRIESGFASHHQIFMVNLVNDLKLVYSNIIEYHLEYHLEYVRWQIGLRDFMVGLHNMNHFPRSDKCIFELPLFQHHNANISFRFTRASAHANAELSSRDLETACLSLFAFSLFFPIFSDLLCGAVFGVPIGGRSYPSYHVVFLSHLSHPRQHL